MMGMMIQFRVSTLTVAAGAAAAVSNQPMFRYWVDELLWSQGRVATNQIEEVLEALGGQRTGGPHKLLLQQVAKQPSPSLSPAVLQPGNRSGGVRQQPIAAAAADSAGPSSTSATAGSTVSLEQYEYGMSKLGLQPANRNSGSSQLASPSSSSSSSLEQLSGVAACEQQAAAGASTVSNISPASSPASARQQQQQQQQQQDLGSSDPDSSSGLAGPSRRPDDHLLGYHHVRQWDLLWTKSVYAIKAARQLQPGQVVSAIAGLNCLTMKKRMVQTLRMALGPQASSIVPLSFCIPEDLAAWQAWLSSSGPAADTGLWMLKTGQDAGKGLRLVAQRPPKNPGKPQSHIKVAQQYITNPLLIQGRKFHLRLWLLVTSHSPLRAYLHGSGLVLFSSEAYDRARPVDGPGVRPAVGHVTNYARNEDTWVWGLDRLAAELGQQRWQELWAGMRRSSALTAASVLGPMRAAHRWLQPSVSNYGFQMLGLDYLVDDAMHPWLLEVNSAPSIMAVHSDADTCRLIKDAKQAMLRDMLSMVQHRLLLPAEAAATGQQRRQQQMGWQQELAAEMANRGGFEPLMALFPVGQQQQSAAGSGGSSSSSGSPCGIPWQEVDAQLQRLLAQQQQQQQ
ncbi:tubulin-tyrosine ligase family-domain-containing protein [Scenedesmus sp. NREL 46B-D3]|nr:tubulin-tyrosine ligase family-domain-containing protein [Scenedesmus sp. NREL 46B-D3]